MPMEIISELIWADCPDSCFLWLLILRTTKCIYLSCIVQVLNKNVHYNPHIIRDRARSCLRSRLPEGVLISVINRPRSKAFGLVPRKVDVLILPPLIHYDNECIVSVDNSKILRSKDFGHSTKSDMHGEWVQFQ